VPAGLAALQAGAAVEQGVDPLPLGEVLLERLPRVLAAAARLVTSVEDELGAMPPMPRGAGGLWVGDLFAPASWLAARREHDADSVDAFEGVSHWCLPAIACFTRNRGLLRRVTQHNALGEAVVPLANIHPHAAFLSRLCQLLLDDEILVIDRPTGRRFRIGIDGVAVNFELHTGLQIVLADTLGLPPVDTDIAACLAGQGPQQIEAVSSGMWSLYCATALDFESDIPRAHWVWNEGLPIDIPIVDGQRTLILDEAAFARTWQTARTFAALSPRVWLIEELDLP
jgi:hypothetical protein